jgi:hypothetical protein
VQSVAVPSPLKIDPKTGRPEEGQCNVVGNPDLYGLGVRLGMSIDVKSVGSILTMYEQQASTFNGLGLGCPICCYLMRSLPISTLTASSSSPSL